MAVPAVTVPELFAAQAARTPDAVAVVCGDASWSYAELDAAAGRLARYLAGWGGAGAGGGGGDADRSAELVTALLAVLKAGAAYLPVDPGYPAERIGVHAGRRRAGLCWWPDRRRRRAVLAGGGGAGGGAG